MSSSGPAGVRVGGWWWAMNDGRQRGHWGGATGCVMAGGAMVSCEVPDWVWLGGACWPGHSFFPFRFPGQGCWKS